MLGFAVSAHVVALVAIIGAVVAIARKIAPVADERTVSSSWREETHARLLRESVQVDGPSWKWPIKP
jgi:hypothetical protein